MIRLCVSLLLVSVFSVAAKASPPTAWEFKSWKEAVARSAAEKKPMFVLFGYEACDWCEHLYRRGMSDGGLRAKYQQQLVLAYVDTKAHAPNEEFVLPGGARTTHAELVRRFRAYPTPSWVYLSPAGAVLHSNRGGKSTPREMQRDLEVALSAM